MMRPKTQSSTEEAEVTALNALGFLAADPERLARFMDLSGLDLDAIRASATDPAFLGGLLDHLLADESLLMVFAAGAGLDPAGIGPARDQLGGGADAREYAAANYTSGHTGGRPAARPRKASRRWPGPGG